MGNYQKHTNPSDNDLLYILDVDGGLGGRPKTKVIEYGNLKTENTGSGITGESAYQVAVRLGFQGTEQQWLESLKGSSGIGVSDNGWRTIAGDTTLSINSKNVVIATTTITLTLPTSLGEIEIYNQGNAAILFKNVRFNSQTIVEGRVTFDNSRVARFLYINDVIGWVSLNASGVVPRGYGNPLLWLQGSLNDLSGNNRNATVVNGTTPTITTGLDNKPVLRFNDTNQELQVTPFLSGLAGASLYIIYTPNNDTNYNLIKTANLDDYWRFVNNGAGFFGTFRSSRFEGYPSNMPTSGSHLISIHAGGGQYEVIQNNVSKGIQSSTFNAGDRFRITPNDKPFNGDISLLLVYPYHARGSIEYVEIITRIKQEYPSLPFQI